MAKSKSYRFYTNENTPAHKVMSWIKEHPYLSIQQELEESLVLHHYPQVLKAAGVEGEELSRVIASCKYRLQQQLTALELLDQSGPAIAPSPAIAANPAIAASEEATTSASTNGFNLINDIFED